MFNPATPIGAVVVGSALDDTPSPDIASVLIAMGAVAVVIAVVVIVALVCTRDRYK